MIYPNHVPFYFRTLKDFVLTHNIISKCEKCMRPLKYVKISMEMMFSYLPRFREKSFFRKKKGFFLFENGMNFTMHEFNY